jgi:hypothetical protein
MLNQKSNRLSGFVSLSRISRFFIVAIMMTSLTAWAINPFAKTEVRDVDTFNQIVVGGLVNVEIKQGEQAGIEVSAFGIDMQDITTTVENGTLTLTTTGNHRGESIYIDVTYKSLTSVKTSGAATIETDGPINSETLSVAISGAGDADLELNVGELNVQMRDNGNLTLNGRVSVQNFKSYGGGGRLDNSDLQIGKQ